MADDRQMDSRDRDPKNSETLALRPKRTATELWEEGEGRTERSIVVRVPRRIVVSPPLEAETKAAGKISHPVILWPLYALGGYLVLRWAWDRWRERAQRGTCNDDEGDDIGIDRSIHISSD